MNNGVPECFEYIEERYERSLEVFVEKCGWEMVPRDKSWPIVGRWYANRGARVDNCWRVVGYWDNEDGDGSLPESISYEAGQDYDEHIVHIMHYRNGDVEYVAWDPYVGVEGNSWAEVLPPTMTRDDFRVHPAWPNAQYHQYRWDRDHLISIGLAPDDYNAHLHGEIVGVTFRMETHGDSLFTIKAWETANDGHPRVRYAGPDFINVQTRRVW